MHESWEHHFHVPHPPVKHSPPVQRAITDAHGLTQLAHDHSRLITPNEARALAGPRARTYETLYSIARGIAWARDLDTDEILTELELLWPDYR